MGSRNLGTGVVLTQKEKLAEAGEEPVLEWEPKGRGG